MRQFRVWLVIATISVAVGGAGGARVAWAKKDKTPVGAGPSTKKEINACGCYKDTAGQCFCGKKGKCACPGDCEPKGCEEKRNKEIQKEVAAETKKAHEADQKQRSKEHASKEPKKKKPSGVGQ